MTRTVLVTGTDLVGKSTLIDGLFHHFSGEGYSVTLNKRDLVKTPIMDYAYELMNSDQEKNKLAINSLLTMSFLVDSRFFRPKGDLLIQDTYVHRTIAYCLANDVPYIPEILVGLRDSLVRFDINIYLTADLATRRGRLEIRPDKCDNLDRLVITDPEKAEKMDRLIEQMVETESNYLKIDTTNISKEDELKIAIAHVGRLI